MVASVVRVPVTYGGELIADVIEPHLPVPDGTPTVLLAHGWCLDHTCWHKVIDELQARRPVRVVTYDQRGHGRSPMGALVEPSVRILGDDLRKVIDATAPGEPLVLAGHSMGGMSIMAYAGLHHPHFAPRVHGVVLASTASSIEGRTPVPLESVIMRVASRAPRIPPRLLVPRLVEGRLLFGAQALRDDVRHAVDQIKQTKMPTIGRFFYAIAKHNEAEALAHFVDVPTHIIAGAVDRLIPPPHAQALVDRIPDARLTVLPEVGHMTTYEATDVIVDALEAMLDRGAKARR